jgi:hypothetical protein
MERVCYAHLSIFIVFSHQGSGLSYRIPPLSLSSYFTYSGPPKPTWTCEAAVHGGALYMPLGLDDYF